MRNYLWVIEAKFSGDWLGIWTFAYPSRIAARKGKSVYFPTRKYRIRKYVREQK